ncbi:MAG: ATP-grasp domain-containing protein [Acidimicrobiales bacterium]
MTAAAATGRRRLLAVRHGYRSIPVLQLAAAADGLCDLLLVVDGADPEVAATGRLLRRLGTVVDVHGLDDAQAVAAVAAHRPTGVTAFRDEDLVPTARLAADCGLPFHTPELALRLADKWEQRRALRAGGVPVPAVWPLPAVRDPATRAAVARCATYPAVVKPRAGSGSRHTLLVGDAGELVEVLAWLDRRPDAAEPMVVEEYLPGWPGAERRPFADYVSVETVADRGRLHHLAVTGRLHPAASFRETGFFVPSHLDGEAQDAVVAAADDALRALGVAVGCVHTEVKLTPDGPRVIEVNGRLGGGVAEMLSVSAGVDLLRLDLQLALGERVRLETPIACERIGYRLFLQPPVSARRVRGIGDLRQLGAVPGVESVSVHLGPGEPVDPSQGTRAFVLAVVGAAQDHDEVLAVNRTMYELAAVDYDEAAGTSASTVDETAPTKVASCVA